MLSKGHRMSEVVLDNQGNSGSTWRRSRVGLLLFTAVVALLCKPLPAQNAGGTASGSGSSGQASAAGSGGQATGQASSAQGDNAQAPAQSSDAQTSGNAQGTAQSGNAQAPAQGGSAQAPSVQGGNAQSPAQGSSAQGAGSRAATPATNRVESPEDIPQEIQLPNPYGLLSLRDLYTQIPSAGGTLRRFGSDAFILGTGNANELPMDLPVGPDYVLGVGDNIAVNMWGGRSDRLSLTIDRQGQIALPEAGTVTLDGLTIAQAQSAIQKALSTQFQGEHVEISLGRLRTVRRLRCQLDVHAAERPVRSGRPDQPRVAAHPQTVPRHTNGETN